MMKYLLLSTAVLLSDTRTTRPVQGWGSEGHEIVANIAYQHLSSKAQSIIQDILQLNDNDDNDNKNSQSPLAKIANWADEIRSHEEYKWTARMHYVDVRDDIVSGGCHPLDDEKKKEGCVFDYKRDCGDDVCAVGAIVNFTNILSSYYHPQHNDEDDDDEQSQDGGGLRGGQAAQQQQPNKKDDVFTNMRQTSLKFVTHIVGDVHQPLHVSRTSDVGGNTITVKLAASARKQQNDNDDDNENDLSYSYPTVDRNGQPLLLLKEDDDNQQLSHHHSHNLHSVWDTTIIEHAITKFYDGSQSSFQASIVQDLPNYLSSITSSSSLCMDGSDVTCVSTWANESWDYALDYAYANVDGTEIESGVVIGDEYLDRRMEVVKKCLGLGGLRLANVLEMALNVEEKEEEKEEIVLSPLVRGALSS